MRRLSVTAFVLCLPLVFSQTATALQVVLCANDASGTIIGCYAGTDPQDATKATVAARDKCFQHHADSCITIGPTTVNQCLAIAISPDNKITFWANDNTPYDAQSTAMQRCGSAANTCRLYSTFCEAAPLPSPPSSTPAATTHVLPIPVQLPNMFHFFDFGALGTGLSFGIGIALALLVYARRGWLANHIIHGNLPLKLPVYGEDIQCLFKRTQRVNWYGRIVFGITTDLAMTHQQLIDVRKYWLGRVIAFDSLRRQRQNELARMHLQLAASAKSEAKDKKLRSQLWAALKFFFFLVFYLIRALFSFLFGFLFIRVTIARLVRGTIIESKDLTLILQAKEAIEQSATYLKEFLDTANTFDGRDEIV